MRRTTKRVIACIMAVMMALTMMPGEMLGTAGVVKASATKYVWNCTTGENTDNFFKVTANDQQDKNTTTFVYNGITLSKAKKMEGSTSIKFTPKNEGKLTLVFTPGFEKNVKINGTAYKAASGVVEQNLDGNKEHVIQKVDTTDLYYMSFEMKDVVPRPEANIASGASVYAGTGLTFSTAEGAEIYYTTDKSTPTSASTKYTGPIVLNGAAGTKFEFKAITVKAGMNSDVETFTYTIKDVEAPEADVAEGLVDENKVVRLTTAATGTSVSIRYTLDKTDPTATNGTEYNDTTKITLSGEPEDIIVLKAITIMDGKTSAVAEYTYTIKPVAPPEASAAAGNIVENTIVELATTTTGAAIYYTFDGNDPTESSTRYTEGGFSVGAAQDSGDSVARTLKAIAYKGTKYSKVSEYKYTVIAETIEAPKANYANRAKVERNTAVTLTAANSGAKIYYTMDESDPDPSASGILYENPVSLGDVIGVKTIKAIAIKGPRKSPVSEFTYRVTGDKLDKPEASEAAGAVPKGTEIILSAKDDAKIYYTTNGDTPTESDSEEYKSPIKITQAMVIKAIAVRDDRADSDVAVFEYTIKKPELKEEAGQEAIWSSVALNGGITFWNSGNKEIFNIGFKAVVDTNPSADVKAAAAALLEAEGEVFYYDFSLVNKDNPTDPVRIEAAEDDGIVIKMPYSIVAAGASRRNEIRVLHGTDEVTPVEKSEDGFSFKAKSFSPYTVIVNPPSSKAVNITRSAGYEEGAFAEWEPVTGADGYMAYVASAGGNFELIDEELIREYSDHWRVDMVGLAKGTYYIKVDAVTLDSSGKNASVIATDTTGALNVVNYDRSGFAFSKESKYKTGSGAYKDDGTLRDDAIILYVTADNAKTIQADLIVDNKGKLQTFTGLQDIITGKQKGYDKRGLDIRIIGCVNKADLDRIDSSAEGLQIKGKNEYSEMNITIEGIGEDAAVKGFGMLLRNCGNVELRNFGVIDFMDDGISMDTDNCNIWVHDLDIFYGQQGSAADQKKGDGSLDVKGDTQYSTFSYNHFWDSGKCSLCGMKSETGPNYLTYHHNWFDHSDSRHPRIRSMSVHVYNNYFDGNSKYGVGVTMGSSAFVESNYFRNCKYPMMSSLQGTDATGDGTFSGEKGGSIKAYGNHIEGALLYMPYSSTNNVEFDAYEVSVPSDKVPAYVKTKDGKTYDNFDTASTMYEYIADSAEEAKDKVMAEAGRLGGGDLKWTFDNSVEDKNDKVIPTFKTMVENYKTSIVCIGGKVHTGASGTGVAHKCLLGEVTIVSGGTGGSAPGLSDTGVNEPTADKPTQSKLNKGDTVTLSCESGATIYYTLNGGNPTGAAGDTVYAGPIVINTTTTVRAIAVKDGKKSNVAIFKYIVESAGVGDGGEGGEVTPATKLVRYEFNPEKEKIGGETIPADGYRLPQEDTQYGTNGYFTIGNDSDKRAKISLVSSTGGTKKAPAGCVSETDKYARRFQFGASVTADMAQAIRFKAGHAATVYVGAYLSTEAERNLYLDEEDRAATTAVKQFTYEIGAGDHKIYAKEGDVCILYVIVDEIVPVDEEESDTTVKTPTANPAAGAVAAGTPIALSCATEGAEIHYTLDGTNPTAESTKYTGPITVNEAVTIKAIAVKEGLTNSGIATFAYTVAEGAIGIPTADTAPGRVRKGTRVTLSSVTGDAKIYYTVDGTEPTAASTEYTGPITLSADVTIKAIAIKGEQSSPVNTFVYTVYMETVSTPVAVPASGAVDKGMKISLSTATVGAQIYYTLDGTAPTAASKLYTEPITIIEALTIKAIAVKENWIDSGVATFEYTVNGNSVVKQVLAPKASIGTMAGVAKVARGTEVRLSCVTEGAKIYYTLDGTVPTKSSTLYEKVIVIDKDMAIKAIAAKDGYVDSAVVTYSYKVLRDDIDYGEILPEDIEELEASDIFKGVPPEGLWIAGVSSEGYAYTGTAIRPAVRVYHQNVLLTEKIDYTISYKNNVKAFVNVDASMDVKALTKAKAPMVTVSGKGNYAGQEAAAFKILPLNIADEDEFEADDLSFNDAAKAKKEVPVLYWNGKSLKKKADYDIAGYYDGQGNAVSSISGNGEYYVELEGKGNFAGKRRVALSVDSERKMISTATVAKIPDQAYERTGAVPMPTVTVKGVGELQQGTHYTVRYSNNMQPGTAYVIITGIGEYFGTKRVAFRINGTAIKSATVEGLQDLTYNGYEQEQDLSVTLQGETLIENVDYVVSYSNNINAGKAIVTITGINAYTGDIKKNFKISAYDLNGELISGMDSIECKFMKGGSKPKLRLTYDRMKLREGVDYTVSYKNNKAYPVTKQPQITVKGKGNFAGTKTTVFVINAKALNEVIWTVPDVAVNSAGKYQSKPELCDVDGAKLVAGKDYEISAYTLEDGSEVPAKGASLEAGTKIKVTLKGKGAYAVEGGEINAVYEVKANDFSKAKITIPVQSYTGRAVTLKERDIVVKVNGTELNPATDYKIVPGSYVNNVNKGTARVTIVGQNGYGGAKTVTFKIGTYSFKWIWRFRFGENLGG